MYKEIKTPCGEIRGIVSDDVVDFKGIRYAYCKRWTYPEIVTRWDGVYEAYGYGNCSYQPRAFYDEAQNPGKAFYYNEFRKGEKYTYDEDCLFLNIRAPLNISEKLPVLVYIHGGGFTGGCGNEKHFDGPVWAKKGVIAVTVNYRLGPMGFACLPELKEEAGHTGNYGLFDQIAAIKWIKNNISAFGGDEEKITIMGQSAGAMSVQHLCSTDYTDGLFRAAVMSSGVGMGSFMTGTPEKKYDFWKEVMKNTGSETLEEFRNISPEILFREWKKVKGSAMSCVPVTDGILIKDKPVVKKIPYMVGCTSHDMAPAVLYALTKGWAKKNNAYMWLFERMLPGDDKGAWHSSDLWYWFGTLKNSWRPNTEEDYGISDKMSTYLCNFVKHLKPDEGETEESWKQCRNGKDVMCFGNGISEKGRIKMLLYNTLTNKPVGE